MSSTAEMQMAMKQEKTFSVSLVEDQKFLMQTTLGELEILGRKIVDSQVWLR